MVGITAVGIVVGPGNGDVFKDKSIMVTFKILKKVILFKIKTLIMF